MDMHAFHPMRLWVFKMTWLFLTAAVASLASPVPGKAQLVQNSICKGDLFCLDQGWSDAERAWWYTASQGSRLLPLDWALALEMPNSTQKFFGPDNIRALGYLENPVSDANPHGLPVGFAVDLDKSSNADLMCDRFPEGCAARTMRKAWVGLNCAACHTAELTLGTKRVRIEGAPAQADFQSFIEGVLPALEATASQEDKFRRFADNVLNPSALPKEHASLMKQLQEQIAWRGLLFEKNATTLEHGHARLDAQGYILNKITAVSGGGEDPFPSPSDAPVSYPFVWNTAQQKQIQWNGIARNFLEFELFGDKTDFGALVRNTSEVIGVFAHIEAYNRRAFKGYRSSLRLKNMVELERLLGRLESPVWPTDVLPPLDPDKVARGRVLFEGQADCARCHAHLEPDDLVTPANDKMTPLAEVKTDVFTACNTFLHESVAGNFERQWEFAYTGDVIRREDFTRKMLVNASVGAIVSKTPSIFGLIFSDIFNGARANLFGVSEGLTEYLPGVVDPVKKEQAQICLTQTDAILAYKARPLNGIWATAPYLHNGSVPSLYDLLLPAKVANIAGVASAAGDGTGPSEFRPETFGIGQRGFDAARVGLSQDDDTIRFTFKVRDENGAPIPGNFNSGHDYGNANLTQSEREDLVEYLKSL
jgi:hypothetical protein